MNDGLDSSSAAGVQLRGSGRTDGHEETETPLAELNNVTVELGGRLVLRDVSARIWPGELIGVIGPNGSGKTTLLRMMLGLLRPQSGEASARRPAHVAST